MHDTKVVNRLNSIVVSLYKAMGFLVLALILGGLFSYLGLHGFFLVNRRWIAPTIISPSDEQVLELNAQTAAQTAHRAKLEADRREVKARLDDAARIVAAEKVFQQRFAEAMADDRQFRLKELGDLLTLREQQLAARDEILSANQAYAGMSKVRATELQNAKLIDREAWLTTNHQIAQMSQSNLAVVEKGVDLENRIRELQRQIRAIEAITGGKKRPNGTTPTVDVLRLQQEHTRSKLELARAEELHQALESSIGDLDGSIARYDQLLEAIKSSPYLKAMERNMTVAFVPYPNVANAVAGTPIYGCRMGLFFCKRVGTVLGVLDGEVVKKHPIRNQLIRGAMVEVDLDEGGWAREDILHLGNAPFFF